jgi:uridine kinase
MDLGELAGQIRAHAKSFPYVIAVDGTIGSGKSYTGEKLREALSPDAFLITMDFFVSIPRKDWDRKIEEGHLRLRDWYDIDKARDILHAIKSDKGLVCGDLYDVETGTMRGCITIDPGKYRYFILEGLFSLDDELDGLIDMGIFVNTPPGVALARAETRDESKRHLDPHGWLEKKEIYYDGYLPYVEAHRKKADIVLER